MLGGPIGALIGVAAGYLLGIIKEASDDDDEQEDDSYNADYEESRSRVTGGDVRVALLVLMACVMKADGRVLKAEVAFVKPWLIKLFGEEGALQALNDRRADYLISYDGTSGSKEYGENLPESLGCQKIMLNAGFSSQAALLGKIGSRVEIIDSFFHLLFALPAAHPAHVVLFPFSAVNR